MTFRCMVTLVASACALGCDDAPEHRDAGTVTRQDSGPGATVDAGSPSVDAALADAGLPPERDGGPAAEPDAGPMPACEERTPPSWTRATSCNMRGLDWDCTSYATMFRGDFPGSGGADIAFFVDRDVYAAFELHTGELTARRGWWTFETPQYTVTYTGPRLMTLSRCPGDFDREAIEREMGPNCYVRSSGFTSTVSWKRPGEPGEHCVLQPGQTYYLNVTYTTDPAGTPPSELQWGCGAHTEAGACANAMAPTFSR